MTRRLSYTMICNAIVGNSAFSRRQIMVETLVATAVFGLLFYLVFVGKLFS